ncbi:hypothetical protein HLB27_14905 [Dickeya dadantii]|uniref:hypothetical protein n=1 Tax=Dickeya dadantii TaxID=204038 RepID=UPI0014954493|nr:hypothetical protein [Dickeya dadantii]NPE60156.1 hypothetical protein [Dickeya dadantii]NPE71777.1 hypothetical protein [Dickeya dadantii]
MTSILVKIQNAIEESQKSDDFRVNENPGRLQIVSTLSSEALKFWQAVFDHSCSWLNISCIDSIDDHIKPEDGEENEKYRLNIIWSCPDNTPYFFTKEGWKIFLFDEYKIKNTTKVRLLFINEGFETKKFIVEPWLSEPIYNETPPTKKANSNPRFYVRSNSPELMAPLLIEPWLIDSFPSINNEAFEIWKSIATEMLIRSLPNELYMEPNGKVCLSGKPPRRLDLGIEHVNSIDFDKLSMVVSWIYLEGDDIEIRHTFFSTELAREWNPEISFCMGLNIKLLSAIESARLLYKAHLRSSSKDTLKSLGDLRKTLADEVQKLLLQSRDLTNMMWKDVTLALSAVAIKYSIDSIKAAKISEGFAIIYIIVLMYILTSYFINNSIHKEFIEITKETQNTWRNKLYAYLDDDDYQTLAQIPLNKAYSVYNKTKNIVSFIVMIVSLLLFIAAMIELDLIDFNSLIETGKSFYHDIITLLNKAINTPNVTSPAIPMP